MTILTRPVKPGMAFNMQLKQPGMANNMQLFVRSYRDAAHDQVKLTRFWNNFFKELDDKSFYFEQKPSSNVNKYQNEVFKLMEEFKSKSNITDKDFLALQHEIEDLTMDFNDSSVWKSSMKLMELLLGDNKTLVRDYLRDKDQSGLSEAETKFLSVFDTYTLEVIIIHVLASVFNCIQDSPVVRVSTLIEQLDSTVRVQAKIKMKMKIAAGKNVEEFCFNQSKVTNRKYSIGAALVNLLLKRELITTDNEKLTRNGRPSLKSFATCNFDISMIPVRLNLPMVCEPVPWGSNTEEQPSTFADIKGGYLSGLTGEFYNQFRLLTSRNYDNFYIGSTRSSIASPT